MAARSPVRAARLQGVALPELPARRQPRPGRRPAAAWPQLRSKTPPWPRPGVGIGPAPISDWRTLSGAKLLPTEVAFGLNGHEAAAAYARGVRGYFKLLDKVPSTAKDPNAFVLTLGSIGVPAYDAGIQVWVVDIGGLAEPLAARTTPLPGRQAGHRKQVDYAWYDARFGAAGGDAKVVAARHALTCGPLPGLLEAIDGKLTVGRFLSNIWHSVGYTSLHVPSDPMLAEKRWCPAVVAGTR